MDIKVIKADGEGNLNSTEQHITGIAEAELQKSDKWREFTGFLIERKEKVIHGSNGDFTQVIYNDEQDERGTQLNLETFSPTDDAILSQLMEGKDKISLYYELITNDYGTKFRIKAIQLPDGTWSAPKAKDSWKKGSATNNRALAMSAAAQIYAGALAIGTAKEKVDTIEAILKTADEFYAWINIEAKK